MNISENNLSPEFENTHSAPTPSAPTPCLSSQEFQRMTEINARVRELKQIGFDVREHLDSLKNEMARAEGQLNQTRDELIEKTQEMQKCFQEYIQEPFGISGQISISETEPHYITVVDSAAQ